MTSRAVGVPDSPGPHGCTPTLFGDGSKHGIAFVAIHWYKWLMSWTKFVLPTAILAGIAIVQGVALLSMTRISLLANRLMCKPREPILLSAGLSVAGYLILAAMGTTFGFVGLFSLFQAAEESQGAIIPKINFGGYVGVGTGLTIVITLLTWHGASRRTGARRYRLPGQAERYCSHASLRDVRIRSMFDRWQQGSLLFVAMLGSYFIASANTASRNHNKIGSGQYYTVLAGTLLALCVLMAAMKMYRQAVPEVRAIEYLRYVLTSWPSLDRRLGAAQRGDAAWETRKYLITISHLLRRVARRLDRSAPADCVHPVATIYRAVANRIIEYCSSVDSFRIVPPMRILEILQLSCAVLIGTSQHDIPRRLAEISSAFAPDGRPANDSRHHRGKVARTIDALGRSAESASKVSSFVKQLMILAVTAALLFAGKVSIQSLIGN